MRARLAIAWTGAGLYAAALVLPTCSPFDPEFSDTTYSGIDAFLAGWRTLTARVPHRLDWWPLSAAWLANPAVWVALVAAARGRWRTAAVAASCGLVLGLVAFPRYHRMVAGHPGYWAWVGPAAVIAIGSARVMYSPPPRAICQG